MRNYFGGTRVRGGDPRVSSDTPIGVIKNLCQGDISGGNPNSYPCQLAASNGSDAEVKALCSQGVAEACRIAGIKPLTAAEKAEMARRRDKQAQADRELTARNIANTCDMWKNPMACHRIAEAVQTGRPVYYAEDLKDARENLGTDFDAACRNLLSREPWYKQILEPCQPWYQRKWIYISVIATLIILVYYLREVGYI